MGRCFCILVATLAAITFSPGSARGQTPIDEGNGVPPTAVTITPFVSLGSFLSSRVGAAIAFPWTDRTSLELEVGYRREEMDALSAHLSVIRDLPRIGRVTPYLAAGIGLEQFGTVIGQPDNRLATLQTIGLSVNAGGGVKVPVDDRWGVRTDARWFNGVGGRSGEHWRVFNGVTMKAGRR